jgi:bacterioferritin-associated ferredoxin
MNDPRRGNSNKKREIICLCNNVPRDVIEKAVREGADTLNKIFDATMAGVGPCGGSCRRKLGPMLDHYLETGGFPEILKTDMRGKKK